MLIGLIIYFFIGAIWYLFTQNYPMFLYFFGAGLLNLGIFLK